jgi:hypothetical protein
MAGAVTVAPRALFVVFKPRTAAAEPRWWHRLLDPFRCHVLALWQDGAITLAAEHTGTVLRVETMALPAEEAARGLMWSWDAEALVLRPAPVAPRACLRPPLTCVELIKALAGIADWRVWTPRQLRRALIRRGARPVPPFRPWRSD